MDARLTATEPASGGWNMGFDEAMLAWAEGTGGMWLRFYQWAPATLSLGYFQSLGSRAEHAESRELPLVRRASGGGAIVHHHELTYSFVIPLRGHRAGVLRGLTRQFHAALVRALSAWEMRASLCQEAEAAPRQQQPFLCFRRRAQDDVLLAGHKIAGSAQRRSKGAVLQHGSVLLGRSPFAPELPGIWELSGRAISVEELGIAWARELEPSLGCRLIGGAATREDLERAEWWRRARYEAPGWTARR